MPDDDPYGHPSDPDEDKDLGARPEPDDAVAATPAHASTGARIRERLNGGTHGRHASPVPGRGRPTWHAWRTPSGSIRQPASR